MGGLRLALGTALLAAVAWQLTGWRELWRLLAGTRLDYVAACIVIFYVGVWISCVKWQLLLRPWSAAVRLPTLMRWYLAGTFAGSFLPSDVGGDLGRGYLAGKGLRNQAAAWSSIVAERLTGLAALMLLASLTLLFSPALLNWSPFIPLVTLLAGALLASAGWALLGSAAWLPWLPGKAKTVLAKVRETLESYARRPATLAACLGLSLLYHLLSVLSLWCVLLALAPDTPFQAAFVWPLVSLIGLLPLTPGGLGVRDGAQAVLLERAGVDGGVALAAALLTRALLWLVALSGLPSMLAELDGRPWAGIAHDRTIDDSLSSAGSPTKR